MELKRGMKVMVRSDFSRDDCSPGGWVKQFEAYRGKVVTIKNVGYNGRGCLIEDDPDNFTWGKSMFTHAYTSKYEVIHALINQNISESTYRKLIKEIEERAD